MSTASNDAELPPSLAAALDRLQAALDVAEDVVRARLEEDLSLADFDEELTIMQDDRNRLAQELDAALARASGLERIRDEAVRRVERASAGVAAVLGLAPPRDGGK
jgi:hypothetical protein